MGRILMLRVFCLLALSSLGACGSCVSGCVGGLTDGRTGAVVDRLEAGEIDKDTALQELLAIAKDKRELIFDSHGGIVGNVDPNCGGPISDPRTAALHAIVDLDIDAGYIQLTKFSSGGIEHCYSPRVIDYLVDRAAGNLALAPRLFQHLDRTKAHYTTIDSALKRFKRAWSGIFTHRDASALLDAISGESRGYKHCGIFSGLARIPFKDTPQSMRAFTKQLCGQFSASCTASIMQVPHGIGYSLCEDPPELTAAQLTILNEYSNARVGESSFTFEERYQMSTDPNTAVRISAFLPKMAPGRLPTALEIRKSGARDKIGDIIIRTAEGSKYERRRVWPSRRPASTLESFMSRMLSTKTASFIEGRAGFFTHEVEAERSHRTEALKIKVVGEATKPDALLICGRSGVGIRECTLYFAYEKEMVEVSFAKEPWAAQWKQLRRNVRDILDTAASRYEENF